jgi:hypothetical protein
MWALLLVAAAAVEPDALWARVDRLAVEVRTLADDAREARVADRRTLAANRKAMARQLDELLAKARFERGLPAGPREELAVRVAWKLEPAVNRALIALSGVETDDDRQSVRTRELAASWYAAREQCRLGKCGQVPDCKAILVMDRPKGDSAVEAARDFDEVAGAACLALRSLRDRGQCAAAVRQQIVAFDAAIAAQDRKAAEGILAQATPASCVAQDPWLHQRRRDLRAAFDDVWPPNPPIPASTRTTPTPSK